jgi:hypothetical protein
MNRPWQLFLCVVTNQFLTLKFTGMKTPIFFLQRTALVLTLSLTMFSFSHPFGGEGFEVYLGKQLLSQHFGNGAAPDKNIAIEARQADEEFIVKYYHCGQPGTNRVITVRNSAGKMVRQWQYGNAKRADAGMSCPVKGLLELQGSNPGTLGIYYSSNEVKAEKRIFSVIPAPAVVRR